MVFGGLVPRVFDPPARTSMTRDVTQAAELYHGLGWSVLRVEPLSKKPREGNSWQSMGPTDPLAFDEVDNIGIRTGQPSHGLIDLDLDSSEAVRLAPVFLPQTWTFGRPGKPRSHWLYRVTTGATTTLRSHVGSAADTVDPAYGGKPKGTLVELRATGQQTVVPPSIHETGEFITWDPFPCEAPLELEESELLRHFGRLAVASIIARIAPGLGGNVHHFCLAMSGALWRGGWSLEDARAVILRGLDVGIGDGGSHREQAIDDTWDESNDRNKYGWPALGELLSPKHVKSLQRCAKLVAAPTPVREAGGYALTDAGNAERFVALAEGELRYNEGIGWLLWQGDRWVAQPLPPVWFAVQVARAMQGEGRNTNNPDLVTHGVTSESKTKVDAMIAMSRSHIELHVEAEDLDADPWLLNVANGTLDLRTGELREHRTEDMITKICPVNYEPAATCPRFVRFLSEVMQGDVELQHYLISFLGYALTGDTREHALGVWHGAQGGNGKGTMIRVLHEILGDYAATAAPEMLLRSRGGRHPTELMDLRGRRLVTCNETEEGRPWNESLVKQLTGGDRVKARSMHKDFTEFDPTWKLVVATNPRPIVTEQGGAFWRRLHLVPWNAKFTGAAEDRELDDKLRLEAPGILRLLVQGCLEWQKNGLRQARAMREAAADYRQDMDTLGMFLREKTRTDDCAPWGKCALRSELYGAYVGWCQLGGVRADSKIVFGRKLRERGYIERGSGGKTRWMTLVMEE